MISDFPKFLLYLPSDNRSKVSGPVAVALNVAQSFVNSNIPSVLIFNGHPELFSLFEKTGIDVRRFDMPINSVKAHFNPRYRKQHSTSLAEFISKEHIDILYMFHNGTYLLQYLNSVDVFKVCTQIAGEPHPQPLKMFHRGLTMHPKSLLKAWYRKYVRLNYSEANLVVCGSNAAREMALHTYGIKSELATTVPWAVASKLSDSIVGKIRQEFDIPERAKLIVSVGRITKAKGVEDFGEVARMVMSKNSEAYRFLFVGPEIEPNYGRMVRRKYGDVVTFLGQRTDLANIYGDADLYIHTSHREAGPQTIIEAMEFGVPAIAWDIPGCNELILPEQNGSLIKFGELSEMANSVQTLLNDPDKYRRFSTAASQMFDQYSVDDYCPRLMEAIVNRKLAMEIS